MKYFDLEEETLENSGITGADGNVYIRPFDQLELGVEDLKAEIANTLTVTDPNALASSVYFDYKTASFEPVFPINHLAVFIETEAHLIPLLEEDEEEEETDGELANFEDEELQIMNRIFRKTAEDGEISEEEEEEQEDEGEEEEEEDGEDEDFNKKKKASDAGDLTDKKSFRKMKNQFDFKERATQTFYMRNKDKGTVTAAGPRSTHSGWVTQWLIHDSYINDIESQETQKEKVKLKVKNKKKKKNESSPFEGSVTSSNIIERIVPRLKILEKMVQLNINNNKAYDFKFYEDEADEFKQPTGSVLPLWRFKARTGKKLEVTSMAWNHNFPDMFTVGLGSYNFLSQTTGKIVFFSLSNPTYPEYEFFVDSGVMSLDLNPDTTYLILVGSYDGNVRLFDLKMDVLNKGKVDNQSEVNEGSGRPQGEETSHWICSSCFDKHSDPVWQVKWLSRDLNNDMNFASISSDGQVLEWVILKNSIVPQRIMRLEIEDVNMPEVEGSYLQILNQGTSFDFHPFHKEKYLVGTSEGEVLVCSRLQTRRPLFLYKAHQLSVYRVEWNKYHYDIFITCSADWTIKIWDVSVKTKEPMLVFDVGCSVQDVTWSPYSSTTFAAVSISGHVYVYDLKFEKSEPLCEQYLLAKKNIKLTTVNFNPLYSVILVGDNKGAVTAFKLSPNLRRTPRKDKKLLNEFQGDEREKMRKEMEYKYLENVISMSRIGVQNSEKMVLKE